MLKMPLWLLEQLAKAGKSVNPSDVLQQSTLDDLAKMVHTLLGG